MSKPQRRRATSTIPSNKQRSKTKSVTQSQIQKKKQHFKHNASMLRQYQKVMKREGYEAGHGGSRKRVKSKKMNPFYKSIQAAEEKKRERLEVMELKEKRKMDLEEKVKLRKNASRLLSRKTKKGQPVMSNVMSVLLNKIQEKHK